MQQEEKQEQTNGEDEARRESETYMGENGVGLRQEQWEEIRNSKMSSESVCKAEKVGEEMGSETKKACKRMSWRKQKMGESNGRK